MKKVALRSSILCFVALLSVSGTATAEQHEGETVVVHLSSFSDDLHAVNMALKLGAALRASGSRDVLFVDLEGVRLADSRQPLDLRWGTTPPIKELYEAFVGAGGTVLVCPHCAAAAGVAAASLRDGAEMGTTESIVKVMNEASKILDY